MKNISLIIFTVAALFIGFLLMRSKVLYPVNRACTLEAKICPDGTSVGRVPPDCEFATCPSDGAGKESGITGIVMLGPNCPVIKDLPVNECDDKPFATTLVVTTPDGARVIKEFSSGEDGRFSVAVSPGEYSIRSSAASHILPYCSSDGSIVVDPGTYVDVVVSCDTGIR